MSLNTRELISQGLFFYNNTLYESSGMYGQSKMTQYEIKNNVLTKALNTNLSPRYFGEGAEFYEKNGKLFFYQLTWQNREM
jgi:glutamine cyclotransferase